MTKGGRKQNKQEARRANAQRLIHGKKVRVRKKRPKDRVLNVLLWVGLFTIPAVLTIHQVTLIQWWLLLLGPLVIGSLGAFAFSRFLKTYAHTPYWILRWLYTTLTLGVISVFGLLLLNSKLSREPYVFEHLEIMKTGQLNQRRSRKCKAHYAVVTVHGYDKRIEFPCNLELKNYSTVELSLAKGFFGFYTIKGQSIY